MQRKLLTKAVWWCALMACLLPAGFAAQTEPLDARLLHDAADGRFDSFELVPAALIAGGVHQPPALQTLCERWSSVREEILRGLPRGANSEPLLTEIHRRLHQRVLRGRYVATATDLRVTLSCGDYNCLSALILYLDLCRAAGLKMEAWLLPGHVCLRCPEAELGWIEPGVRQLRSVVYLNPGKKPPLSGSESRVPSRPTIPKTGRQISDVQLLGKFYYNRGVLLLREQRFAEGIECLQQSQRLDPADGDTRANLLAGLNNWAAAQCRAQDYRSAADLIQQGLALDKSFAPLVANQKLVQEKLAP